MSEFVSGSLPPELSGWEGVEDWSSPCQATGCLLKARLCFRLCPPDAQGQETQAPGSFSQHLPANPAVPLASSKGSCSSACEWVRTDFPGFSALSPSPPPLHAEPLQKSAGEKPQGTLDVLVLIRLSLVVTFKPKQSSGTDGGGGCVEPSPSRARSS